jgi:feruloyl-CoA synthase
MPGLIEKTVANLRDVSPTMYFNAPRGFDMLLPFLEADAAVRDRLFPRSGPDLLCRRGSATEPVGPPRGAIDRGARRARAHGVFLGSDRDDLDRHQRALRDRESWRDRHSGTRCRDHADAFGHQDGVARAWPDRHPGYWKRPDLTEAAFDDEGFYRIGDAGRLDDPADPSRGIVFDGRVAEDFKLLSGTWVHCGEVRLRAIAAASPVVQDAVVTGHHRKSIGLLIFLNLSAARTVAGDATLTLQQLAAHPKVRAHIADGLAADNVCRNGSSMCIARVLLLPDLPSIDYGEITDKGYVNQRAVTERRASLIERLYAEVPNADVLLLGTEGNRLCDADLSRRNVMQRIDRLPSGTR